MFWALEQRRKWRAQLRAEGAAANRKEFEQWLAKMAEERNIPIDELMPPKEGSQR